MNSYIFAAGRAPRNPEEWKVFFITCGAALAVGAVWMIVRLVRGGNRTKQFAELAEELGFEFAAEGGNDALAHVKLYFSAQGSEQFLVTNLIKGHSNGTAIELFDCEQVIPLSANRDMKIHQKTLFCLEDSAMSLPSFRLRRVNYWLDKLFFESYPNAIQIAPQFARKFVLQTTDEAPVRNLFSDECLLALQKLEFECVGANGSCLFISFGGRSKPEKLRGLVQCSFQILEEIRRAIKQPN